MNRGLYTAYTGMLLQQQRMDMISNNLANVNTTGYKKDNIISKAFDDILMMKVNGKDFPPSDIIGKMSFGVKAESVFTNFEQGSFEETNNPLHIALDGTGMIEVGSYDEEGNIVTKYTRDGSFTLNSEGTLMTTDGFLVIGNNGPITINNGPIVINEDGEIYQNDIFVDKISVIDFEDLNFLKKIGNNLYEAKEGIETKPFSGKVVQGFLESSNVNTVEEMVNMINVMRTYEGNQKVINTYDEALKKAVNDIGTL